MNSIYTIVDFQTLSVGQHAVFQTEKKHAIVLYPVKRGRVNGNL